MKLKTMKFSSDGLAIQYIYTAMANRMLVTLMFGSLAAL